MMHWGVFKMTHVWEKELKQMITPLGNGLEGSWLSKLASSKILEWGKSLPSNLRNGQDLWSLPEEMGRAEN